MSKKSRTPSLQERCRQLEQELLRLNTLLDSIGAYVYAKDLDGRYTYVNQLVCELFGCPPEEILGKDDSHFFSLEDSDELKQNDRRVMNEGIVIATEERNVIKETGEVRYYQTVKSPLYDQKGTICGMYGVSTDITKRKKLELELAAKQELLDCIVNNIDAYLYLKDSDNQFLYMNPKAEALFQPSLDSLPGTPPDQFSSEITKRIVASDSHVYASGEPMSEETECSLPNGSTRCFWSKKIPMKDAAGKVTRLINLSTDITELATLRRELQQQLEAELQLRREKEKLAITDPLTGVYNRRKINETLHYEAERAQRYALDLCVILIDIDFFKQVNDCYGHLVGDSVLIEFAKILQQHVRKPDVVGRWGGEEFIVICPETGLNGATTLASNLRNCIEQHDFPTVKQKTASLGVACFHKEDTVAQLLHRADSALYRAKLKGRNRVEVQPNQL